MVQGREDVRLAASELSDEGEHGWGTFGLSVQSPKYDLDLLSECTGEDGSREELCRVTVVQGSRASNNLF
jgi:hypothetical protein